MDSKDELKEIDTKNLTCYYLDDIITVWDRDNGFSDILLDEKLYQEKNESILIYDISHKTFMGSKPLRIMLNQIDVFIKIYNGIRYLVLFDYGWCNKICNRIKYLITKKQIVLIIILQDSELIHIILYISKKY